MTVSLLTQRVIHNTTDISVSVGDYRSGTYAMTYVNTQYVYIGSCVPFNNIWIELSTVAGSTAGTPVVQVWYNQAWTNVVDIIDQTSGLTASGRISWSVDVDSGWTIEAESEDVTGLSSFNIFNRYWMRISWPNNFTATFGYIGQKLSNDYVMAGLYPDLMQSNIMTGFKAGKTTWDEQHFMVAEYIIKDIRKKNYAQHGGQLMDWSIFEDAGCHRVAEIVYYAFGISHKDHAAIARKRYEEEMANRYMVVDLNKDGHAQPLEVSNRSGFMTR
jgi:hypothetical protein